MKWTYRVPQKLVTSLLLSGALIMVLVNNLKERSNSAQLKTAFASIYEDRLMAESYILGLTKGLHQIQESLKSASPEEQKKINQHIANIEQINLLYLDTKLTPNEELHFTHFEKVTWELAKALKEGQTDTVSAKIEEALSDLHLLAEIQVSEAQILLAETERIFNSGSLNSRFEIGLIIVIGLMIQAILFASRTLGENKFVIAKNLN
jgi:hypothetical protein